LIAVFLTSAVLAQGPAKPKPAPAKPKPAAAPATAAQEEQIPPAGPDAMFPAVVARVNGKAILGRDLEQRIQGQLAPIGNPQWHNLREEYRQELISQSLGSLIASELLYQKAVSGGIKVTETETQAEFTKVAKTYAGDAEFNASLASRGMDRGALTKELERTLVVTRFIQNNIAAKVTVTPAEVSQYYSAHSDEFKHDDLVRTSHILILVPDGATAEQDRMARQRAEALLGRIKKGEDFAKLAKENSMDGSASEGGDIGLTPKGQLAPEYERAAFSLPVGAVSDVVRTQFGYHIIKVTDKKKEGTSTLAEIQDDLTRFLKDQKADAELEKTVNELRSQAKIDLLIPLTGATASSPRP
jgi:peptidyl-prolyl cis-trans isomerase C